MRKSTPENVRYKNKFNSDKYDRINLMVPKGQKQAIARLAKDKDESINSFVAGLLKAEMGLTDDEWKNPKTDQ